MKRTLKMVVSVVAVFSLILLGLLFAKDAVSQTKDIEPYEFARIDVPFHMYPVRVYKTVHQGCELFIAVQSATTGDSAASVAITKGRGCE